LVNGTDWTVTLTSGSVITDAPNDLILSDHAAGSISFADGGRIDFTDFERIHW
jgi:hypothetical protein